MTDTIRRTTILLVFRKDPFLAELYISGGRSLCTFRMRRQPSHDQPLRVVETYRAPVSVFSRDECSGLNGVSQWPDELHPSDLAQQFYSGPVDLFVFCLEPNRKVSAGELGVTALQKSIPLAHKVHFFLVQWLFELLHRFEEDDDLIGTPSGDIRGTRLKIRFLFRVQSFPFRGQSIAGIRQRGIKVWFGRESRRIEPTVPVKVLQECVGFAVLGEKG